MLLEEGGGRDVIVLTRIEKANTLPDNPKERGGKREREEMRKI